ncbi:MAG: PQQ-dependent sugar dehydrogenase [Phycisphaerae bacterium]|nr:PQQ-dependent sugar dehydrogenase [Phycisphaerae bacterium]
MRRPMIAAVAVCFSGLGSSGAIAADPIQIELETVATGLTSPVLLTHAGDDSGRLFVVDQAGQIRVIENGVLLPTPFLDLSAKLPTLGSFFDERGFLGLAFHPDYRNNGRFFVRYSTPRVGDPGEPCSDPGNFIVGCHSEVLAEYQATPPSANVADPLSEIILFTVDEPEFNHNAGAVAFGPDGYLYFSLGDGGGANDGLDQVSLPHGPIGNGQNIDTPLGSMLRIDVDAPPPPGLNYAIPPTNPFVGGPGLDEIYAYGFRNPFRFSFDDGPGGDGKLIVGDVGQDLFEEVDIVVAGGNYGWAIREGLHCFDPFQPANPPASCPAVGTVLGDPLLDPVSEYTHADGGLSVIGGFVYRGAQFPELVGKYVYGDFSGDFGPTGRLYYAELSGPDAFIRKEFFIAPNGDPFGQFLKGFGEDQSGEIYVMASDELAPSGNSGVVLRIAAAPTGACCRGLTCEVLTEADCGSAGGSYQGNDVTCLGDPDGDGADGRCGDACPNDPNKTAPGVCGCNVPDVDSDGDGVEDCNDLCPGFDDAIPGCESAIPAASEWSMLILALSLLALGKLRFGRRAFS